MNLEGKRFPLLSLALPILIESVLRSFLGTVNVSMLGHYSDNAAAAVGVANQCINVVVVAFTMITSGTAVLINQHLGAKKDREAFHVGMNAFAVAFCLGAIVSVAMLAGGEFLLSLLGLEDGLMNDALTYLRWSGSAAVFMAMSSLISVLFRCHGNAKVPMFVVMFSNVFNVIFTYLVIYRPVEIPLEGVFGIGVIRFCSDVITFTLLLLLLIRARFGYQVRDLFRWKLEHVKRILGIGFMTGAEGISYTSTQVITTGFLAAFGATALSTKVYVQNIEYYAYIMGSSIGQGAQILSGQMMGAGKLDKAYKYIQKVWRVVVSSNIVFGVSMFLFSDQLMQIFTSDPAIIAMAKPLLAIDIAIHIARSFNHTQNQGLRASGYVFWPMIIAVCSIWACNVGLGYLFSVGLQWGIIGIWIAAAADEWTRGICVLCLWISKRWKKSVAKLHGRSLEEMMEPACNQTEEMVQ